MSPFDWSRLVMVVTVYVSIQRCHCTIIHRNDMELSAVPNDIPANVSKLYLKNNKITALHDCEFCQHTELEKLVISHNNISAISSSAFSNTVIEDLSLHHNQLTVVPDLTVIRDTLTFLNIAYNQIKYFDGEICSEHLTKLCFGRNQLTSIKSSAFDGCTALQMLLLIDNQLMTLGELHTEPVQKITLLNSPLVCDSRLQWLKDAAESSVAVDNFACAGPPCLRDRKFVNVSELPTIGKLQRVADVIRFILCVHLQ